MNNQLLRDIFIVFGVWFVIAYIASGFPLTMTPMIASGIAVIWTLGICSGLSAAWILQRGHVHTTYKRLGATSKGQTDATATIMNGDMSRTLYRVPLPRPAPPVLRRTGANPVANCQWWSPFKKAHPGHAQVIIDALHLMNSKPGLPAGYDGGHGGISLIQHSVDVVESMLLLAPDWRFVGIKNKSGKIIVPLINGAGAPHDFGKATPLACPILPVAAFVHDIGKVACYEMEAGEVVNVLPKHGEKGAELLRSLPSVMALPMQDRDALLLSVAFYHHLSHMPTPGWIGDRTRSLTALLYVADCEASDKDGEANNDVENARRLYHGRADSPAAPEAIATPTPVETVEHAAPAAAVGGGETSQASQIAEDAPPAFTLENGATPMDVFVDVIESPEAINSKNRNMRVAWKHGDWVYVQIKPLMGQVAGLTDELGLAEKGPARSRFLDALLHSLATKGVLFRGEDANRVAPENAIWTVQSSGAGQNGRATPYEALIVHGSIADNIHALPDCTYPPHIVENGKPSSVQPHTAKAAEEPLNLVLDATEPEQGGRTASEYDVVAFTCHEKPLTLNALASCAGDETSMYGRILRETSTGKFALFDEDELAKDFSFDISDLPSGITYLANKRKLVVSL